MATLTAQELEMVKGDTAVFDITCTTAAGAAFDITAATIYFTAKASPDDADASAVFQCSTADDITIVSGSGGTAQVVLDAADTDGVPTTGYTGSKRLYYDVQVIKSGRTYTVARGRLTVHPQITRATS